MWLILPTLGFYSIVAKEPGDRLVVRARVRADLERLRSHFPGLGPITGNVGSDYRYRSAITRTALADLLGAVAMEMAYANVKAETLRALGPKREGTYHQVWSLLLRELHDEPPARNLVSLEPDAPAVPRRRVRRRRR